MARTEWWASGATRRIPLPISGGTAVVLSRPRPGGDGWSMAQTFATAARAVGDTTLTLSATAPYNSAEAWATLRVTANRLIGLYFRHAGRLYRITAHSGAAALTFERDDGSAGGLADAMTAEVTPIEIQADFPPQIAYLLVQTTTEAIRWCRGKVNRLATDFATINNGQSEVILDTDHSSGGVPARNLFMVSDNAAVTTTAEVRCFAA